MPKAKNRLHATRVDRIAIVDTPAVPDAEILVFKRKKDDEENLEKGATSFQDLPVADRGKEWNANEAVARIRKWAGGPEKDEISWSKYRKAIMWFDSGEPKSFGSYKLPYADIVNGKLTAIPKAIIAIVQVLAGGRGGVKIPRADKVKVLSHCKKYYKKMDMEFPDITIKAFEKAFAQGGFMRGFIVRGTEAAVDSLQIAVWDAVYSDASESKKIMKEAFDDFRGVVKDVLAKLVKKVKADAEKDKLTKEEIAKAFARGLAITAISESFSYFKSHFAYLMLGYKNLENPEGTFEEVIKLFEEFVAGNITEIVANKRVDDDDILLDKIGRIISSARLKELKSAISVLSAIVGEAESRYSNKSQEVSDMELKEIVEKLDKISADVNKRFEVIETCLKEHKFLMTDEERKQADADKVEADKKAKEKADAEKVIADKKAEDEKKECEKKDKEEAEKIKKAKDEAEARLVKMEKQLAEIGKFVEVAGKRFGMKTSLEKEGGDKGDESTDTFGDTVRGSK